jgi:4'-phosphopantetheinyl transferase EntD
VNPARLAPQLAELYPPGVSAAELAGVASASLLMPEERASISHCAPQRVDDFSGGRLCAHRALAALGVRGFSLLSAPSRLPIWPATFTGSITHTPGYSAAVVGPRALFRSLGLDSEVVSAVHAKLWPRILSASELARVQQQPPAQRETSAALIFAAKEAFYKSQYPLTGQWLGFQDVQIECPEPQQPTGTFSVHPQRHLQLMEQGLAAPLGRFIRHGAFVSCGVAL